MKRVKDIRKELVEKYINNDFVIDKTGQKLVEIIGATFIADEDYVIRKANFDYAKREIKWYESQSLNVFDIPGKVPKIWQDVSDRNGFINSNYGYLIFSKENFDQFKNCIRELKRNPDSRRATMIYNRPSIHYEYNKNGMSDFICTYANQFFIRKNKLYSHYIMRSNDAVFGYNNDRYWANYVHDLVLKELKEVYPELEKGSLIWTASSFHVYERHFKFLEELKNKI
jgi:thymidylate synthase